MSEQTVASVQEKEISGAPEKYPASHHLKEVDVKTNLVYDIVDEEPDIHMRTWIALAAMLLLNLAQVFAVQGPPAVLDFIGQSLDNPQAQTWVPNSLALVQAVICPLLASISDVFQARKMILVGTSMISFIGAAIAPGAKDIYRLIAAQTLIGFSFAAAPLLFSVPSEILPRRWRPLAQGVMNVAAGIGAMSGPLCIGALTKHNVKDGWRNFYWIQMALWGLTAVGLLIGYRPPKRHSRLDHLSFFQKLRHLDLPGFGLLTTGLTLFLTGLNLGGGLYGWTNARVLATLVIGLVVLTVFGLYEWKGTKTGILNHELFHGGKNAGRTVAICVGLIFVEGLMLFSYILFYPVLTVNLFESDPFLLTVRLLPYWGAGICTTVLWGYWSARFQTIRAPLFAGYLIFTGGLVGMATIQPGDSINALFLAALAGIGFAAPLVLVVTGVQLSTPHPLIATATAVATSSRAVGITLFTAIYAAAFSQRIKVKLASYVAAAAIGAGLPPKSLESFLGAFLTAEGEPLRVPGSSSAIIAAATRGRQQAFADSVRVVFIIAVPFGLVACIACLFLGDVKETMNYRVDAPVEDLHTKKEKPSANGGV